MKAKFNEALMNKDQQTIVPKDKVVEFTITEKDGKVLATLKLDKPINVPMDIITKKCVFDGQTKAELVKRGLVKPSEQPSEQPAEKATEEKPAATRGSEDTNSKVAELGFAAAVLRLNTICKKQLLSVSVTSVSENGISGDMVFFGSNIPAFTFSIDADDLLNDNFEKSVEAFMKDKTATGITNSEEVLETLNEQIEARKKELAELEKKTKDAAKPTAKTAAKSETTKASKKEEKPKEDPKSTLFEQSESEAATEEEFEAADLDEETPSSFDDQEFEE